MRTWYNFIWAIVCAFTPAVIPPACAQFVHPGQWVKDLYLVDQTRDFPFSKALVDEENRPSITIPSIAKAVDFPVPLDRLLIAFKSFWHDDALYTVASGASEINEDGSKFKRHTFAKWSDGEWEFIGEYKTPVDVFLTVIPCDQERFIVISTSDLIGNRNVSDRSPFYRMSLLGNKKELRLDTSIDHRTDALRDPQVEMTFAYNSQVIMTDHYATVIDYRTGLYWIFSLEKASLTRSGKIFKRVTDEMIVKGGFPNAILCANPEKDGTILISALEEAAFLTETIDVAKEMREMREATPDISAEDMNQLYMRRQKELLDRNPNIDWYRIDPEKGEVGKVGMIPIGAALRRPDENPFWRPMPDGSVKMGAVAVKEKAEPVAVKEKAEPQKNEGEAAAKASSDAKNENIIK